MTSTSDLTALIRFDRPRMTDDGYGGQTRTWALAFEVWAQWIYVRGSEVIDAARLQGRAIYKIRLRSNRVSQAVTTEWRVLDKRQPGVEYQVREVDTLTDPAWVYLVVERGVAV